MTVWKKYLLIQIPGCVLLALLLMGLHHWIGLPLWAAASLFLLYVAKDVILYPFLRSAYESNAKTGTEQMIGACGIVTETLAPLGFVEIRGELWQARADPSNEPIPRGSRVRVRAAQDLTLIVTADEDSPPADAPGTLRRGS